MDDELNAIFDDIMSGVDREGWSAWRHPGVDALANLSDHVWARHNDPIGPWTFIPKKAVHA